MCGNGIRCFAKYVYDHGMTQKRTLEVETRCRHQVSAEDRRRSSRASIWASRFSMARKIPVDADGEIINRPLTVRVKLTKSPACRWATLTAVIYLDDIDSLDLQRSVPISSIIRFFPSG